MSEATTLQATRTQDLLAAGNGFGDFCDLSPEQIETFYVHGHRYYEQNRLEQAELFFGTACMMDHKEQRYWMALGAARQAAGKFEEAVIAYQNVPHCRDLNLLAGIRTAECYLALGLIEDTIRAIEIAVDLADESDVSPEAVDEIVARGETLLLAAESHLSPIDDDGEQTDAIEPMSAELTS